MTAPVTRIVSRLKKALPAPVRAVLGGRRVRPSASSYRVPADLARNHRTVGAEALAALRESIRCNYHVGWRSRESYSADGYEKDVDAHLLERLQRDRTIVIPWLDSVRALRGTRVLEIGCGTGSSTVALAEQGVDVVGIDVDEGALRVARDRCELYGVTADIRAMNATELASTFERGEFAFVIFFACLEHMTVDERLASLSQAWELLPPGGMLGVVETPNRLWYHDHHTSWLPFFQWLPDELAFRYSRFSPRENFRELYRDLSDSSMQHFLRRGRGASFHEFDLAIRPVAELKVAGALSSFLEIHGLREPIGEDAGYVGTLRRQCPMVPAAFFERDLDLLLLKSAD